MLIHQMLFIECQRLQKISGEDEHTQEKRGLVPTRGDDVCSVKSSNGPRVKSRRNGVGNREGSREAREKVLGTGVLGEEMVGWGCEGRRW